MIDKKLLLIIILLYHQWGLAQDKVYLLNGDSVTVTIPADPRKQTQLSNNTIGNMNDYGFKSVVAIYHNDSLRIHRPGDIKGYFRYEKGTYLGAGFFFSRTINERFIGYKYDQSRQVFLQRVNFHKNLTIWFYREDLTNPMPECYFLAETKGQEYLDLIKNYKDWKKWAVNHPPLGEISYETGKPKEGKKRVGNLFEHIVQVMEVYKNRYP